MHRPGNIPGSLWEASGKPPEPSGEDVFDVRLGHKTQSVLQFGNSKCVQMHVGSKSTTCHDNYIDTWTLQSKQDEVF